MEPAAAVEDATRLRTLIEKAQALSGQKGDPKLKALCTHLAELLAVGARPVIFCRYLATAHYVAAHLKAALPKAQIDAITGELTPEERELRVSALGSGSQPILVATDCLSEGINLQHGFTAVVHYDLAWNPTRHEQREGRVDRFGQKAGEVRCTMLYGEDNPVDGFILNVILRKAERIRRELGVLVPLPQDSARLNHALIKSALLKRHRRSRAAQLDLGFEELLANELRPVATAWDDAMEKAKANRTVFAQRSLKPKEVLPEWRRQLDLIGNEASIARFVTHACSRLNAPLEPVQRCWRLIPRHFPEALRERLAQLGLSKDVLIDFHYPSDAQAQFIHRTHPLVNVLADHLLETALQEKSAVASRCAATVTADVTKATSVFLLRLRHQLTSQKKGVTRVLMAEETVALALEGRSNPRWLDDPAVLRLLEVKPSANLAESIAQKEINGALDLVRSSSDRLVALARARADALLQDHRRVRTAAGDQGRYTVTPCLPVDVIGVYVLLPDSI